MKVQVGDLITRAQSSADNGSIDPPLKSLIAEMIGVIVTLTNQLALNSSNSSKPPSMDPNRQKRITSGRPRKRKPGGQNGHKGLRLEPVQNPDAVEELLVDQTTLPPGRYTRVGFEARQVIDLEVSIKVTEYPGEILADEHGVEFMAEFPEGVTEQAQYGTSVKATSVYMSQSQLIPLGRVQEHFRDQLGLALSKGSVWNWNVEAYEGLEEFEAWARCQLLISPCNSADETGINVGGKRLWLHCVSNEKITLFHPDERRGREAMDQMGILPSYKGVLIHDHWKPYFAYGCAHALCNAHHLRELEAAVELESQKWAARMQGLLIEMRDAVAAAGGALEKKAAEKFRARYRKLLVAADKECPPNKSSRKQTKARNLLDRLRDFEAETLRFLEDPNVPFTNNRGENDLRMTKVQQKISGCFRSMEGAQVFCRIRSYLLTCKKNGLGATEALQMLFNGRLPDFIASG